MQLLGLCDKPLYIAVLHLNHEMPALCIKYTYITDLQIQHKRISVLHTSW